MIIALLTGFDQCCTKSCAKKKKKKKNPYSVSPPSTHSSKAAKKVSDFRDGVCTDGNHTVSRILPKKKRHFLHSWCRWMGRGAQSAQVRKKCVSPTLQPTPNFIYLFYIFFSKTPIKGSNLQTSVFSPCSSILTGGYQRRKRKWRVAQTVATTLLQQFNKKKKKKRNEKTNADGSIMISPIQCSPFFKKRNEEEHKSKNSKQKTS